METSLQTEMRNQRKKQNWFQNQRVQQQKKMKLHLWNSSRLLFGHTWSGKFYKKLHPCMVFWLRIAILT